MSCGRTAVFAASLLGSTACLAGQVSLPAMPVRSLPSQLVGLVVRNQQAGPQAGGFVTFGQTFLAGAVPGGAGVSATVDGAAAAVQMDAKTRYPDGSVKMAVLTLQRPALAAGQANAVMLSLAPAASGAPVGLGHIADWSCAVDIAVHGGGTYHVDAAALLAQAEASQGASVWLAGPLVSQARIDAPVTGSLHLTFDISRYADGSMRADVAFNNDYAMRANGGTLVYDASITQDNLVAFSRADITHYQYQTWHRIVATAPIPQVDVAANLNYLERTGAVLNYDPRTGINSASIAAERDAMRGPGFDVLGNDGILQYMPQTGGRGDIGPETQANTMWLMTGDSTAAAYAMAQADGAGSVPWHFFNAAAGHILTTTEYPGLWADPRGALTQQVSTATGWTVDFAHAPDLAYVPYLLTGSRYDLDQLNAEANAAILQYWPQPRTETVAGRVVDDIVVGPGQQPRGSAWSLREEAEAAYANPDGSFEQRYFSGVLDDNFTWLLAQFPSWSAAEGQAYGWIPSIFMSSLSPWQQDYFASSVSLAASQGNAKAVRVMGWLHNFITQRFTASGFDPRDGANYTWIFPGSQDNAGIVSMSWASIEATQLANGNSNGSGWSLSNGDYAQTALQSLAGDISTLESPVAIKAYAWLVGYGPQGDIGGEANPTTPQFNVVPRLADGGVLTGEHTYVINDSSAHTVSAAGVADQMIVDIGSGNDVLMGGARTNVLYAGSGAATLIGGAGDDYLFGGTGTTVMQAGAGTNWMQSGVGADVFAITTTDRASDTISGFRAGTDYLYATDGMGVALTSTARSAILGSATSDEAGDAVLHLTMTHSVTLLGVPVRALATTMFTAVAPVTHGGVTPRLASTLQGWGSANTTGNVNMLSH